MKFILNIVIILLMFYSSLNAKINLDIPFHHNNDTCRQINRVVFLIGSNSNYFDFVIIIKCENIHTYDVNDYSVRLIDSGESAYLVSGNIESNNFEILIRDNKNNNNTHRLYYNQLISKVVLEDFHNNRSEQSTYEEADNYFNTQQIGDLILITKKNEIDVYSVTLCGLEGKIISNLQNVEGWSRFSFDMFGQSSGMYLIRFNGRDKSLTKRVLYLK